jgi:hypothetical protein
MFAVSSLEANGNILLCFPMSDSQCDYDYEKQEMPCKLCSDKNLPCGPKIGPPGHQAKLRDSSRHPLLGETQPEMSERSLVNDIDVLDVIAEASNRLSPSTEEVTSVPGLPAEPSFAQSCIACRGSSSKVSSTNVNAAWLICASVIIF